MKKWYCPKCRKFYRISKVEDGYMGYPDRNICKTCGTELVKSFNILNKINEKMIQDYCDKEFINEYKYYVVYSYTDRLHMCKMGSYEYTTPTKIKSISEWSNIANKISIETGYSNVFITSVTEVITNESIFIPAD